MDPKTPRGNITGHPARSPPSSCCCVPGAPVLTGLGCLQSAQSFQEAVGNTVNITEQLASHIKCKCLQRISNSTNTRLAAGVSTSRSLTPSAVPRAAGPCDGPGTSALALFWARSCAGDHVREDEPGRPPLARVPVWQGDPLGSAPVRAFPQEPSRAAPQRPLHGSVSRHARHLF